MGFTVFKIPFAHIVIDEAHRIIKLGFKNLAFLRFLDILVWPLSSSAVNQAVEPGRDYQKVYHRRLRGAEEAVQHVAG